MAKREYKLKHILAFDEETHSYWPTQEALDTMNEKYAKYSKGKEAKGETPLSKRDYFNSQGFRHGRLTSITTILGKIFPFTGGDLKVAKFWLKKIYKKGLMDETTLDTIITTMEVAGSFLETDLANSQEQGTQAHEEIQNYIEKWVNQSTFTPTGKETDYFKAFFDASIWKIDREPRPELHELLSNIKEILPCETPVGYFDKLTKEFLFTGMWDGLFLMKDGSYAIIDIKTGSEVKGDKKLKVQHQLNGYNALIQNNLDGVVPNKHYCIEVSEDWKEVGKKEVNVKLHEFKPNPASFFVMKQKYDELEKLKGGKE